MLLPGQGPLGVHPHHPPLSFALPYRTTDVTTIICDPILIALVCPALVLYLTTSVPLRTNNQKPSLKSLNQRRTDVKRHVAKYSPQLGPVLDSILELRIPALYLVVYARSPVELTPIISALADLLSTDRLNLGCLLQPTHTISFERLRRFHMHLAEAI
ncbi:hypothetical protein Landi51_03877 [Colletotrichum acutatum]